MITTEFLEFIREIFDFIGVGLLATYGVLLRDIFIYGSENVIYKDGWVKKYAYYFVFFGTMGLVFGLILK